MPVANTESAGSPARFKQILFPNQFLTHFYNFHMQELSPASKDLKVDMCFTHLGRMKGLDEKKGMRGTETSK